MKKFTLHFLLLSSISLRAAEATNTVDANDYLSMGVWSRSLDAVDSAVKNGANGSNYFPTGLHYWDQTWDCLLEKSSPEIALAISKKLPLEHLVDALDSTRRIKPSGTCYKNRDVLIQLLTMRNKTERPQLSKEEQTKANSLLELAVDKSCPRLTHRALDSGADASMLSTRFYKRDTSDNFQHELLLAAAVRDGTNKETIMLIAEECPTSTVEHAFHVAESLNHTCPQEIRIALHALLKIQKSLEWRKSHVDIMHNLPAPLFNLLTADK